MDVTITEKRLTEVLHKYLSTTIKGFDKCEYDWAEFGCGMGVCCDPYAIGFVLPDKNYDDYLFKLVDGENYNNFDIKAIQSCFSDYKFHLII